jgi:flagellar M-ring protein FliF
MDQLAKLIAGLSLKQKASILLIALAAGAGVTGFVHLRHEGDFRPLYTALAPEDAATVIQKLKESGVEYRLSDSGGSVLVPTARVAESRLALAAAGLPKSGRIGFELFDKNNFGTTEFVEHINYQRALEGELERSVMSLGGVEEARVHLTLPKDSVFLDQQQPAKASVMVKLRPGAQISPQNVAAVTNLVASAVEGLAPESVSVVDMDGTLLSRPRRTAAGDGSEITTEALEVRQQLERNLVMKISQTLEPLLGPNGFRAGASVDCDLTSGDEQEEVLDPTRSVMLSSQKTEDVTDRADRAAAGGVPGTAANLPPSAPEPSPPKSGGGISRRTENITYQASRTVRHTRIPQGVVRRMSLAVLVDQAVRWEGDGPQKHRVLAPPAPETLATIKSLVAGVTGFNAERGDQLTVESLPFESSLNAEPPSAAKPVAAPKSGKEPVVIQFIRSYRDLWAPVTLALALLLVLARYLFRPRRARSGAVEDEIRMAEQLQAAAAPAQLPAGPAVEQLPAEDRNQLAERIRHVARKDPVATANVLRMWMQESKT